MRYSDSYNREMTKVQKLLEEKGYVLETDNILIAPVENLSYFQEVCDWLYEHGYTFKVDWIANSDSSSLAIHSLYDTGWFTREEMQVIINQEAENQIYGR